MKIAIVSAEYPNNEMPSGGIGTYVFELANALAKTEHYVEVFCGSFIGNSYNLLLNNKLRINTVFIPSRNPDNFKTDVEKVFFERHKAVNFDVIESPEYGADALEIKKRMPNMPLVVKLHTPRFLTSKFEVPNKKLKRFLNKYWFKTIHNTIENNYNRTIDKEYQLAKLANIVCSPSQFLIKEIKKDWNLKTVFHNPNLYEPSIEYLNIKQRFNGDKIVVTFIGSLCHRKGIDVFLEVIPKVLKRNKKIHFNFIGKDNWGPKYGSTTKKIFNSILSIYKNNIHFTGSVPLTQIPNYLAQTDFCIFPSIWENFPYVCLEAMSAGLFVIGSENSGMAEILEEGGGVLINPKDANAITASILEVAENLNHYRGEGLKGRDIIKKKYQSEVIVAQTVSLYQKAIIINKS